MGGHRVRRRAIRGPGCRYHAESVQAASNPARAGLYRPPPGSPGAGLDCMILHRVARQRQPSRMTGASNIDPIRPLTGMPPRLDGEPARSLAQRSTHVRSEDPCLRALGLLSRRPGLVRRYLRRGEVQLTCARCTTGGREADSFTGTGELRQKRPGPLTGGEWTCAESFAPSGALAIWAR